MLREVISNDLFTVAIILGLVFVTISKSMSPKRFNDFVAVLGNSKYLKIYARDQKFFDLFDALLFANYSIGLSVFGIITYNQLLSPIVLTPFFLSKLVLAIAILIVMKILIERLLGSVFEIEFLTDNYLFQKITYKNFIGLVLIPINFLLVFTIPISNTLIYILLGLIIIIFCIGILTTVKTHQNLIKQNLFYFILYLCALEIAPYIILYAFVIDG
ncbi:DUF4271 domain-containing protein [Hanstruepera marina]|uniref:DUF4271 domain-containing protein n=1 Tax=Hanstruepera marina TaxID=2873265 RepID=UPI001CA67649|nr:DUF4271 domain-containing protein [Hanstruepera marina]